MPVDKRGGRKRPAQSIPGEARLHVTIASHVIIVIVIQETGVENRAEANKRPENQKHTNEDPPFALGRRTVSRWRHQQGMTGSLKTIARHQAMADLVHPNERPGSQQGSGSRPALSLRHPPFLLKARA